MKKLLILGGSRYSVPVIKKAHDLGLYVITCDYLPDNIAHKYSDEYCNVSIIDMDAVLDASKKLEIDGIMSFACDPGVVTAAYVAEKMELPFQCSYQSAKILQDKGLFRKFLTDNHFNCPNAKSYDNVEEPYYDIDYFNWPVIVKPVDSAGSKGITKVDSIFGLSEAISTAIEKSHSGKFIIEDFIVFDGFHSSADIFVVDGKLSFIALSDHLFDTKANNPYVPISSIWPSSMKQTDKDYLTSEIQRLIDLLDLRTGIYNIETCVGMNGKPYIMEMSPRGGGNNIAKYQELAFGNKFIESEVRKAVGMPIAEIRQTECVGCWCYFVIHVSSNQSGIFKQILIKQDIKEKYIKAINMNVKSGSKVGPFTGANMSLGDMFLRFDSRQELDEIMAKSDEWLKIELT